MQQQVKVDEARVGRPAAERSVGVVRELSADEEPTQPSERAAVSAWEYVQRPGPRKKTRVGRALPVPAGHTARLGAIWR